MKRPRKPRLRWQLKIDDALIDIDWEAADRRDMLASIDEADALIAAGAEGEVLTQLREDRATLIQYAEKKSSLLNAERLFMRRALKRIGDHATIREHGRAWTAPASKARSTAARDAVIDRAVEKVLASPEFVGGEYKKISDLQKPVARQLEEDGHLEVASALTYRQVYNSYGRVRGRVELGGRNLPDDDGKK